MARLRRSDCTGPGIRRRGRGRGFEYLDEDGRRITDTETVTRLAELRVPPAWKDVWICSDPMGHLQATGEDAAGRKQYLYHQRWRERRDQQKFDEMLEFARALPRLRRRVGEDLTGGDDGEVPRDRVLACCGAAARPGVLPDRRRGLRGGERDLWARDPPPRASDDRGRRGPVRLQGEGRPGAGCRRSPIPRCSRCLRALKRRRSADPELLAFREGRRWVDVRSDDVNAYIKEAARGEFSAKDFRTWHATVLAAIALASHDPPPATKAGTKRAINEAVKGVAAFLGNTPAVCRRSYIDPRVIDRFSRRADDLAGRQARRRRSPRLPLAPQHRARRAPLGRGGLGALLGARARRAASPRSPKTSTAATISSSSRHSQALAESTRIEPRRARTRP